MAVLAQPASAHTEDAVEQLSRVPVGPYQMTVWIYPGVIRAGSVHYTVALLETATARPLNNADVFIKVTPLAGQGAEISGRAVQGTDAANPSFYETDLLLKERGNYQVEVVLQDPSGQVYSQGFQVEVVSATSLKVITAILLVQTMAFILWFLKESLQTWGLNRSLVKNQAAWAATRMRAKQ